MHNSMVYKFLSEYKSSDLHGMNPSMLLREFVAYSNQQTKSNRTKSTPQKGINWNANRSHY